MHIQMFTPADDIFLEANETSKTRARWGKLSRILLY